MTVPRRAAGRATLVLAVLGLAVAVYLTVEHYTAGSTLACPGTGALDCAKVTGSQWSVIAGIPVAVLGLVFFVLMTALTLQRGRVASTARIGAAAVGSLMVLYLVYVELFRVNAICLWCTGVHVLTVGLLGTTLWWHEQERVTR